MAKTLSIRYLMLKGMFMMSTTIQVCPSELVHLFLPSSFFSMAGLEYLFSAEQSEGQVIWQTVNVLPKSYMWPEKDKRCLNQVLDNVT
jgi:hypothetical protein